MREVVGITLFESEEFGGAKIAPKDCICTLRANKVCAGIVEVERLEINVLGQMDNTLDGTFESANRVYDENGLAPTIPTCGGGGTQPKVLEVKQLGFMDNGTGQHQSNTVYDTDGICPNITTIEGGGTQQIKILDVNAIRMVRTEEGKRLRKDYENGTIHHGFNEHRQAELREDGCSNTLSTVLKDNLVCEIGIPLSEEYHKFLYLIEGSLYLIRIRKLIPKECWNLMDFTDEDFFKAEKVVSNSQYTNRLAIRLS